MFLKNLIIVCNNENQLINSVDSTKPYLDKDTFFRFQQNIFKFIFTMNFNDQLSLRMIQNFQFNFNPMLKK